MKLIRLTQASHPDIADGKELPCYVDADRIIAITTCMVGFLKEKDRENRRALSVTAWDALHNTIDQLKKIVSTEGTVVDMGTVQSFSAGADAFREAVRNATSVWPEEHSRKQVTKLDLTYSIDNATGMYYVVETPEQIYKAILEATPRGGPASGGTGGGGSGSGPGGRP